MIKKENVSLLLFTLLLFAGCVFQKTAISNAVVEIPIAFPGAEGFGKFATGGRGGTVYTVTNLNDDGEGSLRFFLNKKGSRIIVFAVSGTIHLASPLNIKANTTIAGQTAPGDGICIADHPVKIDGNNVIVRYMRFRMGDRYQNVGKVPGAGHDDALSAISKKNIIIDHCSISWSTDEVLSVYNGDSTTIQWSIISEPLNFSYHFEKDDTAFQYHGYGGIWGGKHLTAHHNLFAHCLSRNPRFAGIRSVSEELIDYRNNVIYNWGNNSVYGGEGGNYNLVNNYYKYGPSTNKNVRFRIVNPSKNETISYGKYFVEGNYVDGATDITTNNWQGVHMGNGGTEEDKKSARNESSFAVINVDIQNAEQAYKAVLAGVGASYKRDTMDQRIINDVKNRTGKIIDVQGGLPAGTSYELTKNAWPILKGSTALTDTDKDGIPDAWELKNNLDANNAADASTNKLHNHYTNIEVYINSLVN